MTCQSGGKPKFVDRDKNAAANILLIGPSERPKPFCRNKKEDALLNKASWNKKLCTRELNLQMVLEEHLLAQCPLIGRHVYCYSIAIVVKGLTPRFLYS